MQTSANAVGIFNADTNSYTESSNNVFQRADRKFRAAAAVGTNVYFAPSVRTPPRPPAY